MFALSVMIEVHLEHREDFLKAALAHATNSTTKEKDCLAFEVFESDSTPSHFYFHEVYTNKTAFEAVHLKTAYFAEYTSKTAPWVKSKTIHFWNKRN